MKVPDFGARARILRECRETSRRDASHRVYKYTHALVVLFSGPVFEGATGVDGKRAHGFYGVFDVFG